MYITDEKIMEIIRKFCGENITAETDLIAEEILDSYALIGILSCLEELGISIDPAEESISTFSTPEKIISAARKYSR